MIGVKASGDFYSFYSSLIHSSLFYNSFNFYVNDHRQLNETILMTYLQSRSMASLVADENSGEIQRIMGLGRILCS